MPFDAKSIGQQIAKESRSELLTKFDRDVMGGATSVQVRLPLRDPLEARRHLEILAGAVARCLALTERGTMPTREALMAMRFLMREANGKINAYRKVRPL